MNIFNKISNFGYVGADISFKLKDMDTREKVVIAPAGQSDKKEYLPLYSCLEPISGVVHISLHDGKKVEHTGIKLEAVGQVEVIGEGRKKDKVKFSFLVKELRAPGTLFQSEVHNFDFNIERVHETYRGKHLNIRYFCRLTISRAYGNNIVKEIDLAVRNIPQITNIPATITSGSGSGDGSGSDGVVVVEQPPSDPIKMEVGIEDCLHIEFEFDKSKYYLDDVVIGTIKFLLVRIKIKHMELAIIQRENAQIGSQTFNNSENMCKYELMDGAPIKDEIIPVRLFLRTLPLTPTYRSVGGVASVKYYLNLVLIDEEDRRYFKQHEVIFARNPVSKTV